MAESLAPTTTILLSRSAGKAEKQTLDGGIQHDKEWTLAREGRDRKNTIMCMCVRVCACVRVCVCVRVYVQVLKSSADAFFEVTAAVVSTKEKRVQ